MNVDAAVARYAPQGRFAEGFARGKMTGDPVYPAVLAYVRPGTTLVDVGCGEGYLLALAAETVGDVRLVGFDHDARRLASAEAALTGLDARLWCADARVADVPAADAIAVLDVLHYQPPAEQDALLERLARALRPGGVLLVRDGRSDGGWRSGVTALSERVLVGLGRHKGDGVWFRPQAALEGVLRSLGLDVQVDPCAQGTPFANVLFVASAFGASA